MPPMHHHGVPSPNNNGDSPYYHQPHDVPHPASHPFLHTHCELHLQQIIVCHCSSHSVSTETRLSSNLNLSQVHVPITSLAPSLASSSQSHTQIKCSHLSYVLSTQHQQQHMFQAKLHPQP